MTNNIYIFANQYIITLTNNYGLHLSRKKSYLLHSS